MQPLFLALTIILAPLDWLVTEKHWQSVRLVSKPAVLLALIAWFSLAAGWDGANLWFGLALVFSLLGDINLMFPERFFLPGLVSFLLAHIFYILGFNTGPLAGSPLGLVLLAVVAAAGVLVYRRLRVGLHGSPEGRRMMAPVILYSVTISLMLASAWLCLFRPGWPTGAALCAGIGAALFFSSDSVLAYNRFVAPTRYHDLVVMSTYHLGQIALIAGVVLKSTLPSL
jgi:uncharacterized membrane protein YhhN